VERERERLLSDVPGAEVAPSPRKNSIGILIVRVSRIVCVGRGPRNRGLQLATDALREHEWCSEEVNGR
jgi:hypothetical protein